MSSTHETAYNIEGDWGDFHFRLITPQDYSIVLEHLKAAFYPDEVMFGLAGYSEAVGNEVNLVVQKYLERQDGISFLAIHKPTNKIAGVRISYREDKDDVRPNTPVTLSAHQNILGFVGQVASVDILDEFGIDFYAEHFMTSVEPEFRRRGLVTELYRRSLELVKSKEYPLAASSFSSPYTRRVASSMGFIELKRFYYAEALDDNGYQRFPSATPDQFVARMVKKL